MIQCSWHINATCIYFLLSPKFVIENQRRAYSHSPRGGSDMVGLMILVGILVYLAVIYEVLGDLGNQADIFIAYFYILHFMNPFFIESLDSESNVTTKPKSD